ncbi:Arylsulfatase [Novipirellula aureliae]|uniref:Arylsulfatase n=1 Tax=Novipirellula aureliae TaxID=2527966 RepID=A0A5C6E2U6_9BACT|nr:arylsulfatase [Novipirellula aureliae]TWU43045.1 Arylsulfatase [Novipirellula aureliae]
MRFDVRTLVGAVLGAVLSGGLFSTVLSAQQPPNIVVILVDDLGYSDIGCYGGEIETPNLDALASGGVRFSQFYNTAKCHSSRVSLLTGQYCIAAGDTALSHAVTSAEVLRDSGYFTAMAGKWHLKEQPTDFGFDRYFGHLSGACNYFAGDNSFRLNGEPWTVPKSDFYTTVANIDYALDFLGQARQTSKPFYLYVAFNAPHAPLHALPEDYAKYKGRYDAGWDIIRDARIAKQKATGLLPQDLVPSPRPEHVRAWDKLVPWQRDYEINRMVTLAAMIDRVDQEVGRLVDDLRRHDELDNTMILFVSDNGACPYDRKVPRLNVEPTNANVSLADSTGWSWARNAPFRFYKQNQFEGGISTPGILHWPSGLKRQAGTIVDTPVHLIDVLPTLADVAGATIPSEHPERDLRPVSGVSLKPILAGDELDRPEPIHLQFATDYGLRDGDWKLVNFKGQAWELYNMVEDRAETNNLAAAEPERLNRMIEKWKQMSLDVLKSPRLANPKILPAEDPKSNREWTVYSDTDELPVRWTRKNTPNSAKKQSQGTAKDAPL